MDGLLYKLTAGLSIEDAEKLSRESHAEAVEDRIETDLELLTRLRTRYQRKFSASGGLELLLRLLMIEGAIARNVNLQPDLERDLRIATGITRERIAELVDEEIARAYDRLKKV